MPVTVLDLAEHRLRNMGRIAPDYDGSLTGADFEFVGLPIMGGCELCGATVAAYNSCPSRSGFIRCENGCIGDDGFDTVEEADDAIGEDRSIRAATTVWAVLQALPADPRNDEAKARFLDLLEEVGLTEEQLQAHVDEIVFGDEVECPRCGATRMHDQNGPASNWCECRNG